MNEIHLYLDDSGTRHPDRKPGRKPAHGHDYFAFGGILVQAQDEAGVRDLYEKFCGRWNIDAPLHSSEIRSKSNRFSWLTRLDDVERERFYEELYQLMVEVDVLGTAAVLDRPGYDARYREKYGRRRWHLCKTAFCIVLERAAKYAISQQARLRVWVERSSKKDDRKLKEYFEELRTKGLPFESETSAKYQPLGVDELKATLYDLKFKHKSSPMVQLADLYTWPMCMGGYDSGNRPYVRLMQDQKLIDSWLPLDEVETLGIKYSCFDLVHQKQKNPPEAGS